MGVDLAVDVAAAVREAEQRIRPHVRETELEFSEHFSRLTGARVYLKCENLQHTGSFKVRGAFNCILSLQETEPPAGFVAASTGNHGKAIAYALQQLGANGVIFMPHGSSTSKVEAIEEMGGEIRFQGTDCIQSERAARAFAAEKGFAYVSPYNDERVIAGQGTIAAELERQLESIDAIFVSVGGGGLISGVGGFLKTGHPGISVYGCSPVNSAVMIDSVEAGEILDLPSEPTLSDATAGGVESGSITFDLCRRYVDEYVKVTEAEIREGLREFTGAHDMPIEGSAAVALMACVNTCAMNRVQLQNKNVVVILCGGNINPETLRGAMAA